MKNIKRLTICIFIGFAFIVLSIGMLFILLGDKKTDASAMVTTITAMADGGTFQVDSSGMSNGWTVASDGESATCQFYYANTSYVTISQFPIFRSYPNGCTFHHWMNSSGQDLAGLYRRVILGGTIYPAWERLSCTINFDKLGGSGGSDYISVRVGLSFYGQSITPPTKEGYSFGGYRTPDGHGLLFDSSGNTVYSAWTTGSWGYYPSYTVSAIWNPKTYTVTLDSDGHGGQTSATPTFGSSMPQLTNGLPISKAGEGKAFAGYYAKENNKTYYDQYGRSANNWDIPNNTTLYALWKTETYNITFYANNADDTYGSGGTVNGSSSQNYQYTFDQEVTVYDTEEKTSYSSSPLYFFRSGYRLLGFTLTSSKSYSSSDLYKLDSNGKLKIPDMGGDGLSNGALYAVVKGKLQNPV